MTKFVAYITWTMLKSLCDVLDDKISCIDHSVSSYEISGGIFKRKIVTHFTTETKNNFVIKSKNWLTLLGFQGISQMLGSKVIGW